MQCPNCQSSVQSGDRFCQSCGHSLSAPQNPAPAPSADAAPAPAPASARRRAPQSEGAGRRRPPRQPEGGAARRPAREEAAPRRPSRARSASTGMWVGALVVMLGIGALIYWQKQEEEARKRPFQGSNPHMGAPASGGMGGMGGGEMGGDSQVTSLDSPRVPSPQDISGKISIAPDLQGEAPNQGAFYIMARPAGAVGAPPIAAVKLPASTEPTPFVIGPSDLMMGGDFNQPVTLQVRWDQDGDPMTRQATDLVGEATPGPVKPGSQNVSILLNRAYGADEAKPPVNLDGAPGGMAASAPAPAPASAPAQQADSAPAAPADGDIQGLIKFSPELAGARPSGGILFVIARPAGSTGGPPLAVKRVQPSGADAISFSIGQRDAMMGGDFNQPVTLQVRWDQDGNAMSKQPGDLASATSQPIQPGTKQVELLLNQKM